jgi:hypothetical protein
MESTWKQIQLHKSIQNSYKSQTFFFHLYVVWTRITTTYSYKLLVSEPVWSGLEKVLHIPMRVVRGHWMGEVFRMRPQKLTSRVTAGVHDKDSSLFKSPERRALQPFTGNGDVSIWVKDSREERKTINNQSINKCLEFFFDNKELMDIIQSIIYLTRLMQFLFSWLKFKKK